MKTFRKIAEMHYASEPNNEFDKQYRENRINALEKLLTEQLRIHDVISHLKYKLEVNAGRIAEPLLKAGKQPLDDEKCHKAFLVLAHLEAIEDYINGL